MIGLREDGKWRPAHAKNLSFLPSNLLTRLFKVRYPPKYRLSIALEGLIFSDVYCRPIRKNVNFSNNPAASMIRTSIRVQQPTEAKRIHVGVDQYEKQN